MNELIYPRSPRETMCGWIHLPRYIDKIRMHLAGKLHSDYQENLGKRFDGVWLQHTGLQHEQFVEVVRNSLTDGQVCDWVRKNVKRTDAEKQAYAEIILTSPRAEETEIQARFQMRKAQAGVTHRPEVKTFVDLIDADEKRI